MGEIFKHDDYTTGNREKPLAAYVAQMTSYIKLQHPDVPEDRIREIVRKKVTERLERPKVTLLDHPVYGDVVKVEVDLLEHTHGKMGNRIIVPSGTVYELPSVKLSPIKKQMGKNIKLRKKYKELMLEAKERGEDRVAKRENNKQNSRKIENNSLPGASQSPYNVFFDRASYNSVTSAPRQCVRAGYAHVERHVAANIYVTSLDDVINYCVLFHNACPPNFMGILNKYGIVIPEVEDVFLYFSSCLRYYTSVNPFADKLMAFLSKLPLATLAYVYYGGCLKNILTKNDAFFRPFLEEFFQDNFEINPADDPGKMTKAIEPDLRAVITSIYYDHIEQKPLADAVKECPDGVRQLMAVGRHMNNVLSRHADILSALLRIDVDTPNVIEHPNMVRRCTLVSDTDSVIFTTHPLVVWYTGKEVDFSRKAYEINGFSVYIISRTIEHVFARLSVGFGMEKEDLGLIVMKNEYLYPVMMRTMLGKHYAAVTECQEGRRLPKKKKDIKGLSFRGSDLPALTNDAAEKLNLHILNSVIEGVPLYAKDIVGTVVQYERTVYESLVAGQKTYLTTQSVKFKEDYEDDPMLTDYFYYTMWMEAFEPKFGPINLPTKCLVVPILGEGKAIRDTRWHEELKEFDVGCYERLSWFLAKYPDKKITFLLLPPTLDEIPPVFRRLIDARKIVHKNGRPFYLVLSSCGLALSNSDAETLACDYYYDDGTDIHL